jgi:hypothetical protein
MVFHHNAFFYRFLLLNRKPNHYYLILTCNIILNLAFIILNYRIIFKTINIFNILFPLF